MSSEPHYPTKLTKEMFEDAVKAIAKKSPGPGIVILGGRGFGKSLAAAIPSTLWSSLDSPRFREIDPAEHPFLPALLSMSNDLADDILEVKYMCLASSNPIDLTTAVKNRITGRLSSILYDYSESEILQFMEMIELQEIPLDDVDGYDFNSPTIIKTRGGCSPYIIVANIVDYEAKQRELLMKKAWLQKKEQDNRAKQQMRDMQRYAHRRK
jgi:hypothetical protein